MSLFTLDTDRIVRMFHANGINISLKKAFRVAGYIENLHLERMNETNNLHFDQGQAEGLRKANKSYETGYNDGKTSGTVEMETERVSTIVQATIWAEGNMSRANLNKKIRCIKEVREEFPTIGLREAKVIVERISGNGYGMMF